MTLMLIDSGSFASREARGPLLTSSAREEAVSIGLGLD